MPRILRMAVVLATFMALFINATGGNAAELKVPSACHTVLKTSPTGSTGAVLKPLHKLCANARKTVTVLSFIANHRVLRAPRYDKCWQVPDQEWRQAVCKARRLQRVNSAKLQRLNQKIDQKHDLLLKSYVGYLPPETARQMGMEMAADMGWTVANGQFGCLDELWGHRESHWYMWADNPKSDAFGIPQALPGTKMGPRWKTSAWAQIRWGLDYIFGKYTTPCGALATSNATGAY